MIRHLLRAAFAALASLALGGAAAAQQAGSISAANINVIQNGAGNSAAEVTVTAPNTVTGSAGAFTIRSGSNRGDYNIQIGASSAGNASAGILITSVRQNGRNNSVAPNAGGNTGNLSPDGIIYGTPAVDVGGGDSLFIPIHAASTSAGANGGEFNTNVSAAYFPFADGWVGGYARNEVNNEVITDTNSVFSPGLSVSGGQVRQAIPGIATGDYVINLSGVAGVPANASQNGVLLVVGGKNEDNYALGRADANGNFLAVVRDNGSGPGDSENDPFAFVYVPNTAEGVVSGRVTGSGAATALVAGVGAGTGAAVTDGGLGTYFLSIAGVTDEAQGVLLISGEGGTAANADNFVSYEWDDINDRFVIQTRALPDSNLFDIGAGSGAFSFVFVPVPEPATVFGVAALAVGGGTWLRRRRRA